MIKVARRLQSLNLFEVQLKAGRNGHHGNTHAVRCTRQVYQAELDVLLVADIGHVFHLRRSTRQRER